MAELGLGFDLAAATEALNAGLGVVPRPVSFAWPESHLVERTLVQAARLLTASQRKMRVERCMGRSGGFQPLTPA